jgi:hypothetical protein
MSIEPVYQIRGTGHDIDALFILSLTHFNADDLRLGFQVRCNLADDFDCADPVCNPHHFVGIGPHFDCPATPLTIDRSRRIYQHAIEVKQNRRTIERPDHYL